MVRSTMAKAVKALLVMTLCSLVSLSFSGCTNQGGASPAAKQGQLAGKAAEKSTDNAIAGTNGVAAGIDSDVNKGRSLTPDPAKPALNPVWDSLSGRATTLRSSVAVTLEDIKGQVGTLVEANTQLQAEAKTASDRADKAEKAASHNSFLIQLLAYCLIAGGVAGAFFLKDYHWALAGIAGGGAVLAVMAIFAWLAKLVEVFTPALYIGCGLVLVCGVWLALEIIGRYLWTLRKKTGESFASVVRDALYSPPWQDIQDAVDAMKPSPPAPTGLSPTPTNVGAGSVSGVTP